MHARALPCFERPTNPTTKSSQIDARSPFPLSIVYWYSSTGCAPTLLCHAAMWVSSELELMLVLALPLAFVALRAAKLARALVLQLLLLCALCVVWLQGFCGPTRRLRLSDMVSSTAQSRLEWFSTQTCSCGMPHDCSAKWRMQQGTQPGQRV